MGCIIAATGIKTLCGGRCTIQDVLDYFNTKQNITCAQCLIRQDAMFERGYEQKLYHVWYTRQGSWVAYSDEEYKKFGSAFISLPRQWIRTTALMWDNKTVRGAIKLGKLGVHNMGVKK